MKSEREGINLNAKPSGPTLLEIYGYRVDHARDF